MEACSVLFGEKKKERNDLVWRRKYSRRYDEYIQILKQLSRFIAEYINFTFFFQT